MAETNLERLQRRVYSCDTEAGHRLRYLITRAQADKNFASKIGFSTLFNVGMPCGVNSLFIFANTVEGSDYWQKVQFYTEYPLN